MSLITAQFLLGILLLTVVALHINKRNASAAYLYGIQSLVVAVLFLYSYFELGGNTLLFVVLFTILVKVILAPLFFLRLIRKHDFAYSVSTYVNTPLTLLGIAFLIAVAHLSPLTILTELSSTYTPLLPLSLATILLSLFLIINRKGSLSQIIGILSLENSIVTFAVLAGLEQSPVLQIGVIFNILIWIIIATVFVSLMYRHFGAQNVTDIKHLTD